MLAAAGLMLVGVLGARADILLAEVTPESAKALGFAVKISDQKAGMIDFEITRDLTVSEGSERFPYLTVLDEQGGTVLECTPRELKQKNSVLYLFRVAPAYLKGSQFQYSESAGRKVLGGGTSFRMKLADFVKPPAK